MSINNNENNIKTITFNENIVFNNEKNNINNIFFENQNIIIEEQVAIKNDSILYKDDIVYLRELENQLLSEYPVKNKDSKYIQKDVEKIAKKIIEVKNIGLKNDEMFKKNIEYTFINDIINDKFTSNVLPIVIDKHKIYSKLVDDNHVQDNENENLNIYYSESFENKNGIIDENQRNQMITLKSLFHDRALNKLSYKEYLNKVNDITKPYINNISNIGYIKKPKDDTDVLRYYDLDTIYWNSYKINNDYLISKDILDEFGKIKGLETSVFIKGDDINIVGFILLDKNNKLIKEKTTKIITKITNLNNKIRLECKNHKLNDKEIIYIENSNCIPKIDNRYSKSVKIIDKDTIELDINIKLIEDGTHGDLLSDSELSFKSYKITKNDGQIIVNHSESKEDYNKVYLFDNININKEDYDNIIKKIIPNLNQIIEYERIKLNNAYTFDNINNIIKPYSIDINSFKIEQILIIKEILYKNLEKYINKENKPIIIKNKNNNLYFKDDTYFLSNKYITDPNIEELYGKYIHINKPEDNLRLRLQWIEGQKDNGTIYYLYFIKDNTINNDYNHISNKINELQKLLDTLQTEFKKEKNVQHKNKKIKLYKYQAYIISEEEAKNGFDKLIIEPNTIVFYNNNLYIWKNGLVKLENVEDNTLALVGDSIWSSKKDIWYKTDAIPKYENIKYLCELNNLDISTLKLDSLDCIYRKDMGCYSKLYIRLENTINKIEENLNNYHKLNEYIKAKNNIKNITTKINFLKEKFYGNINKKKNLTYVNEKFNNIKHSPLIIDNLSVIIKLINLITDDYKKSNYIYELIDKDGLLIGNDIYSKKYKRKMDLCSHYYYYKKIDYANSPAEKSKLIDELLNIYSDFGETEKNFNVCKVCGVLLINNEYDDTEGFNESGMIKKSRELWVIEKDENKEDIDLLTIDDKNLKDILIKYGLSVENIDEAISISIFIIKNLFPKAGVKLPNSELINIVIDSLQKVKNIVPFYIYRIKEIKKLQEKGFSQYDIDKVEEKDTFKSGYSRYFAIRKNSIIISRFLISIQTTIPQIIRSSKSTLSSFYSFDGDEGITYMASILNEMGLILLKDKSKILEVLKISILESYDDFKKLPHIKKLFQDKKIYLDELKFKKNNYQFKNEIENIALIEPIEIGNEFNKIISKSTNIIEIKKLHNILLNRLYFLGKLIKNTVRNVIANSSSSDQIIGILETSCCTEDVEQYLDYYFYIETESEYPIKKNIDESKDIVNYTNYFINKGVIDRFILYDKNKFDGIYNNPIVDDQIHTSESLIKDVFKIFVDTGIYAGTQREYIGNIDIKTGLNLNTILEKNYSITEYQNLLKNIENRNIKYYKNNKSILFEKNKLDNLKKDSTIDKIDQEINNLVKNIAIILNKDKKFIDKYVNLLRKIGIFNDKRTFQNEKEKIKNREYINKTKLSYIKKFYITKLKKYLSIIKNNLDNVDIDINLKFIENEEIEKELQSTILKENNKLLPFLNHSIRNYFMDLKLDYTNEEINSINGMDDIYDSKYDKIKSYSNFNFNEAANVLLYMFIMQLHNFIFCDAKNNSLKCLNICKFILLLFEELDMDNDLFNLCIPETQKIKNSLEHDKLEYKVKLYYKDSDETYFDKMMKIKMAKDFGEELQAEEEIDDDKDKIDFIKEKGKKELAEKYGYNPSEDEIETFKDDYLESMEDDVYDLDATPKGKDVLDQGAAYGDFNEFDFEDGDGFDYSDQMIE